MKTPEEIKKALKACNKEPISMRNCAAECPYHTGTYSCLWDLRKDSLALIDKLEEQISLMKIQMHGDCGVCKHRSGCQINGRDIAMSKTCYDCMMKETRPNWEYEGLPEVKSR